MKFSRCVSRKRKIPPTQYRRRILSGETDGKIDRVCCGAVNLSGIIHGEAVFKMNTTTSCGEIQATPQNRWDLQESTTVCGIRQEEFEKFMAVKWRKWDY
jgi:hypothetical protein